MTPIRRRRFLQATASSIACVGVPLAARAQATLALRFSSSMTADDNAAHYVWYQRMAANLRNQVGEAIRLDYFPNNQLGKESDVVQQVKVGAIDMMVTGSSIWATVLPEIGMLDLGYMFDNYGHMAKVAEGGVGKSLNDMLQQRAGCTILTWASHFGPRNVYTKQPIKSLADIKGVKLRVLPTPAFIETFKIMGAIPTPIPFGELYMSAQTGVVDGFEHDAGTVLASKLNEVTKSCWQTEHLFSPMVVVIGRRSLDKIPAPLRAGFMKAVAESTGQQRVIAADKATAAIEDLKKKGMTFFPMSAADRAAVRKEMEARLWADFARQFTSTAPLFAAINAARA
ncbi:MULTISPECIES: TRAP transporter substrate-binding protein [Ramlibacter]|uniref:DctP family TRAP transporter solute-binding subunit n=1 Tax=Ramlibacter pinisoli TaxID=2682844 RepID=A0A6N8IZ06_9BURK|nr:MULTISPECIES: TRAP transporter substrate-binding protein [Ramlibacter]MBA2962055.1 TRAP transporter substrate-binding protein [Ramlibacter sp. CGMCC 1.13660]MVQ31998.1 DctP family TRAP transporter solute-binding subunit [Ramlibacter pinisoli]